MMSVAAFRSAKRRLLLSFLLVLSLSALHATAPLSSAEGVFALDSKDPKGSLFFSMALSSYEKQFLSLTGYPSKDFPPVLVVLHGSDEVSPAFSSLRVDCMTGGMMPHIQVDLVTNKRDGDSARNLLALAMLLREYYGSSAPTPGAQIPVYPAWMIHGLGLLCSPAAGTIVIPSRYLHGEEPPTIESFLTQKPPDEENQSLLDLYDAQAAALLQAVLNNGKNVTEFRDWIGCNNSNNATKNPPSWPTEWKTHLIEKRWLLLMAVNRHNDGGTPKLLGIPELFAKYDALLAQLPTKGHSLILLQKEKGGNFLVQELAGRMAALRLEAPPLAVPLLDATIQLLSKLKHGSQKKLAPQEKELTALRSDILKQSKSIGEYLDWYEAAKLPVSSGLYDRLLSTPETPLKKGPLGHYLDLVEARGW